MEDLPPTPSLNSPYIGHLNNKIRGIEINSGSLGPGLPVSVGMALAGKMGDGTWRVYEVGILRQEDFRRLPGLLPLHRGLEQIKVERSANPSRYSRRG